MPGLTLQDFIESWNRLGWLANAIQIVLAAAGGAASVYQFIYRRIRRNYLAEKAENDHLLALVNSKSEQVTNLQRELAVEREYNPLQWEETLLRELKAGNDERGLAAARTGLRQVQRSLQTCCIELAKDELSRHVDESTVIHLQDADRFARLAAWLDPHEAPARNLHEVISARLAHTVIRGGLFHLDDPRLRSDSLYLSTTIPPDAQLRMLWNKCLELWKENDHFVAERIAHRAVRIAQDAFGERSQEMIGARYLRVRSLTSLGEAEHVVREADIAIELSTALRGERDSLTLDFRFFRASALSKVDMAKAQEEFAVLPALFASVHGAEHMKTVDCRFVCAAETDKHAEGIQELRDVLQAFERVRGKLHSQSLLCRLYIAQHLCDLNRHEEALHDIDESLELWAAAEMADSRSAVETHLFKANVLRLLRRAPEAVPLFHTYLKRMEEFRSERGLLAHRHHFTEALIDVGSSDEALEQIELQLKISQGAHRTETLFQRARALYMSGNREGALSSLDEAISSGVGVRARMLEWREHIGREVSSVSEAAATSEPTT